MNDDWLKEIAEQQRRREDELQRQAEERQRSEAERIRLVNERLPIVWRELLSHLTRKVSLFNERRGKETFSMDMPPGDQQLSITCTMQEGTQTYLLQSIPGTGSFTSRIIRRHSTGGSGEGSGDLILNVTNGAVSFATVGRGEMSPEEAADYLLKTLLRF